MWRQLRSLIVTNPIERRLIDLLDDCLGEQLGF